MSMSSIWARTLRNAYFWELPRIRGTLFIGYSMESCILNKTAESLMSSLNTTNLPLVMNTPESLPAARRVYSLLLWVPVDYLTRAKRSELVQRALDIDLMSLPVERSHPVSTTLAVREFLRRVFTYSGLTDALVGI